MLYEKLIYIFHNLNIVYGSNGVLHFYKNYVIFFILQINYVIFIFVY